MSHEQRRKSILGSTIRAFREYIILGRVTTTTYAALESGQ